MAEAAEAIARLQKKKRMSRKYHCNGGNLVQVLVLPLADFAVGWEVAALREAAGEGEAKEALQEALFG